MAASHPAEAAGFCFEPRAPTLYVSKPTKPFCAVRRECSQWKVDSYKSELERYFNSLVQYRVELDKYYKNAYEYIECMAELDK